MPRTRPSRRRRPVTTESEGPAIADTTDDEEAETGPLRRCIITRERMPKERMIRFVVGPDRQIVPDLGAKLPGRGIWLSACRDVLGSNGAQDDWPHKSKQIDGAQRRLERAFARA